MHNPVLLHPDNPSEIIAKQIRFFFCRFCQCMGFGKAVFVVYTIKNIVITFLVRFIKNIKQCIARLVITCLNQLWVCVMDSVSGHEDVWFVCLVKVFVVNSR